MARLEELQAGLRVRGIVPGETVEVIAVDVLAPDVTSVTYRQPDGRTGEVTLYRSDEHSLEIVPASGSWTFTGVGDRFRLAAEALRIHLAHLFDRSLALHSSRLEPLPHQIVAVYEHMLPRQPLRFVLADDPGSGKTIMAGLLIKEMLLRGDAERCLIVCPGILVEQWQTEMHHRFDLSFEIATKEKLASAPTGNWFCEHRLVIARMDQCARDSKVRSLLQAPECRWDLVVVDEAHKMAASYTGNEVKYTRRYELGRLLSAQTQNFLLLTATPHNGKPADFQLFLQLLDEERFGHNPLYRFHDVDVSDVLRRVLKEDLVRFDGTPLFPERRAYTRSYALSPAEAELYRQVTEYVRGEFNRADELEDHRRAGTVSFALMTLQRRLASSPEAIYRSLERRRQRLEEQAEEFKRAREKGERVDLGRFVRTLDAEDIDELDEFAEEDAENELVDQATAARNLAELEAEIATLRCLEGKARELWQKGEDRKWLELRQVLEALIDSTVRVQEGREDAGFFADIAREGGQSLPPKLIIFTEFRDTLEYLVRRIEERWPGRVAFIHGGLSREKRLATQERFATHPELQILVATDAAGEGINLQCAHLVVNHDLPWNPNRIEQRFGRVHRIGQTKPCSLWNLVAEETREGEVYLVLLSKLEEIRRSLGGRVFDVLGKLQFDGRPLAQVLLQAVRQADETEARTQWKRVVHDALDLDRIRGLIEDKALAHEVAGEEMARRVSANTQRARALRLHPYAIESFFLQAFQSLGGKVERVDEGIYSLPSVPLEVRQRADSLGEQVRRSYPRVSFRQKTSELPNRKSPELIHPGHPLLRGVVNLTLERERHILKQGCVLVDERDEGVEPRLVFGFRHSVVDGTVAPSGAPRAISQRFIYVEVDRSGSVRNAGWAPHLSCRALRSDEPAASEVLREPECVELLLRAAERSGPTGASVEVGPSLVGLERLALQYAAVHVGRQHREEVAAARLEQLRKVRREVEACLRSNIAYLEQRARELRALESSGKATAALNAQQAQRKAEELKSRLRSRLEELDKQAHISSGRPVIECGFLVVPLGLLRQIAARIGRPLQRAAGEFDGLGREKGDADAMASRRQLAVQLVLEDQRRRGREPLDRSAERLGYEIEGRDPERGSLDFIKVFPVSERLDRILLSREEVLVACNDPEHFVLALVDFVDGTRGQLRYVRPRLRQAPPFDEACLALEVPHLLKHLEEER
ncbi:RNA polymerase-associated protein RapA [bacterium HR30]|nr:RNA polymerase-associated protein RapA [bacterium HR30]